MASFSFRFLLAAAGAVVVAFAFALSSFVLLTPAFMRHGPAGPIEPAWLGQAATCSGLVLGGYAASRFFVARQSSSLASCAVLGVLIGALSNLSWLGREWLRGVPFAALHSPALLTPFAMATLGALLGGLRRNPERAAKRTR